MAINVVYIGMGGQGGNIVNEVKKYAKDNDLLRPGLRFIAFDSHQESLNNLDYISDSDKIKLLEPDEITVRNQFPEFYGKIEPGIAAGNKRLKGRLFWLFNRNQVISCLDNLIDQVKSTTGDNFFVFIINNALGGGTGSGSFIEVAVYLKNHPSLTQNSPIVMGIGILPGGKDENDITLANGYAALKEVNFLQCLDQKKVVTVDAVELNYSKPFDFYFILDREYARVTQDEEIRKAIISFLTAFGWFEFNPSLDREAFEEKYLKQKEEGVFFKEISNFRALGEPIRDYFHTIGYSQIFFPRDNLLLLYDMEDETKNLEREIAQLDVTLKDVRTHMVNLQDEITSMERETRALRDKIRGRVGITALRVDRFFRSEDEKLTNLQTRITSLKEKLINLDKTNDELTKKKEKLEKKKKELEAAHLTLLNRLINPSTVGRYRYFQQLPLTRDQIDALRKPENRERLKFSDICFREIMDILRKLDTYYSRTHGQINRVSLIDNPMISYNRIAENHITAGMMEILTKEDRDFFPDKDPATGKRIMMHERIKLLLAICSTCEHNIDRPHLASDKFRENVRQYYAQDGSIIVLERDDEKYSFNVYFALLGLQPWRPSETKSHRAPSVSKMEQSYKRQVRSGQALVNHSLFIGTQNTAFNVAEVPNSFDNIKIRDDTLRFWTEMDLINPKAIWNNVPIVVSEFYEYMKQIKEKLEDTKKVFDNVVLRETYSDFALVSLLDILHNDVLSKLRDKVTFYQEKKINVEDSIFAIKKLLSQIEIAHGNEPSDIEKKNILDLTRECIEFLRDSVLEGYNDVIEKLNNDEAYISKGISEYLDIHQDKIVTPSAKENKKKTTDKLIEVRKNQRNTVDALNELKIPLDEASTHVEMLYQEMVGGP
ncbi:MAG: tubulin-like doman-containing protein [Candidatus Methanofastidiosia archaeon]